MLAASNSDVEVITSYLTIAESRHIKTPDSKPPNDEVKRLFRSILSSGKVVKLAELTQSIAEKARDLHWDHEINLSGADSIHIATALITGCKEFLTFDFKKSKSPMKFAAKLKDLGLTVIEPASTKLLPADYKQQTLLPKD